MLLRESEFTYAPAINAYLGAQTHLDDALGVVPVIDVPPTVEAELSISE
jgi:hypothetical protein